MASSFVHLHVHTHYSLLQALPKLDELVKAAKNAGMDAVAITDYGAVYGVIEFIQECQKKDIKPIIGQCAYVALEKYTDKRPRIDDRQHQLVLLCETEEGYRNLLKLTTIANLEGFYYKPRIDKDLLRQYGKGLIGLSGGAKGEICKALAMDEFDKAEKVAREYEEIFGKGNFFLELQDHPELDDQQARNRDLIKLSEKTGIPLVATKDVHYLTSQEAEGHDVLLSIGDGRPVQDERRPRMTDADYSFVSSAHMEKAFSHVPEAIANTRRIADRCNVKLDLGKWNFAEIAVPEGETYDTWLRKLVFEGIAKKVPEVTQEIKDRLEYELGIIQGKGYSPYFLVVSDYMRWAMEHGIMTTTRGSAAGSLVSYAIDIVPVNPLTYKLPFERFLNPFRPSPPDIDGDFEDARRDEVIAYVTEKYGKDKVAQIGTFGTMAARGSVRDVGRALGLPYALCDRMSKMIPMGSQGFPMTIERAIEQTPEIRDEMSKDPQVAKLLELAQKVEGCARHVSVHAAGVVIAPRPLTEYTALQKESGGEKLITQYEMNSIEAAGVLKSDFLGIRNLTILGTAVKNIKKTKGLDIDIRNIPLDDAKTYKMLSEGETIGLFQLNGAGMTRYLKELKPSSIHDIMAMVALFRPGPMDSIPEYIRRKHDPSLVTYLDPRLKEILDKSYGIMTYQDDVLLTAIHIAGYNWEEADKLRKAMGKKIPEEMMKQEEKFLKGCVKGGTTEQKARQLWELIKPFAAYGFNKAHAAAYGMVAYQTSYLKANWPAEYMAAVLTAESGDADTVASVVTECGKMGMAVLPPDVNSSETDFTYIDDKNIRFGLYGIKNLGTDVAHAIIAEREANGPFLSIADLAGRVGQKNFNKKSLESLIKAGALDSLGERNYFLGGIDAILAYHKRAVMDADSGQSNLFGAVGEKSVRGELKLAPMPPATKRERLAWERELLGLYVSEHPFKEYDDFFGPTLTRVNEVRKHSGSKALFPIGGIIMDVRVIFTKKKNEPMAFVKLEDTTGTVEVVVFPSAYKDNHTLLVKDTAVMVEGKYDEKEGETKVLAEKLTLLTTDSVEKVRNLLTYSGAQRFAATPFAGPGALSAEKSHICIAVPPTMPPSMSNELKRVFAENPGGRRVFLMVKDKAGAKKIETSYSIAFSGDTVSEIEKLVGRGAVQG
jgi:DNA polymerase-3 subunit alpha